MIINVNFVHLRNFLPQTCRELQPLGIPTPFVWVGQSLSFMVPLFHSFPKATVASPRRFIGRRELVTVSLFAISELSVRVMWYSRTQRGSGCPANGKLYNCTSRNREQDRQTDRQTCRLNTSRISLVARTRFRGTCLNYVNWALSESLMLRIRMLFLIICDI